jgi:hypothetical protein
LFIKYLVSFSNKNHGCLKVDQIPTTKEREDKGLGFEATPIHEEVV